jgi:outer membrane protein assembly factor BamB
VARAAWAASIALATASQAVDWTFYRKDLAGTANAGEPLTLDQAGALEINREIFLGKDIFSNPVVANGNLYYTAGGGYLHAVSLASYTEQWKKAMYASGLMHFPDSDGRGCLPTPRRQPPVGAPAVVGTTVFAPGGDGVVYSFDLSGNQNWATKIADVNNLGEFLWSSIFPLNGKLYIGVSSLHDCLLVPGRLVALDQVTGALVGTWWGDANHLPGDLDAARLRRGLETPLHRHRDAPSPDLGESSIVSSPYANGTLFVAGAKTADGLHRGAIAALDAFTGLQKWIFYPEGFVLPAMTVTGQVLFAPVSDAVTGRGKLYVLDQAGYAVEARLELDPLADEDPHRIGVEPDARLLRAHGGQVERGGRRRGKGGGQGCAVRDAAGAKAGAGP